MLYIYNLTIFKFYSNIKFCKGFFKFKEKTRIIGHITDKTTDSGGNDNSRRYYVSIEDEDFSVKRKYYEKVTLNDLVQFDIIEGLDIKLSLDVIEDAEKIKQSEGHISKIKEQVFDVTPDDKEFLQQRFRKHRDNYILITSILLFFMLITTLAYFKGQHLAIVFTYLLSFPFAIFLLCFIIKVIRYLRNKDYDKKIGDSSIIIDKEVDESGINSSYYILTSSTSRVRVGEEDYEKLHINDKLVEFRQMKGKNVFSILKEGQKTFYVAYSAFTNR